MDVQELKVKVLYTVAPSTQAVMALTRRVPVTLIPSAEPGELGHGKVLLRHCLLAICHSNPDLIGDAAKDFSVYALDPLEPVHAPLALPAHVSKPSPSTTPASKPIIGVGIPTNGTAVGLGLMSWCLDGEPEDDDDAPFVVGSVFMHPAMGRGLQVFLTLHEMAARSREQHGTLMKQWSTPTPAPAPAPLRPAPTPYLASSPIIAAPKPVPARPPPPPPKTSKAKKPASSTPAQSPHPQAPPPGAMFVPHPHHAPYYHPHASPYGMPMHWGPHPAHPPPPGMDANAAMMALQQQAAKGEAADWTVLQQALSVLAPRMLPPMPPFGLPMPDPTAMSSPMPPRTPYQMPPPTPHQAAPTPAAALPPPPPPAQRVQRTKTPSPKPRPATPAQTQLQAQLVHVTTPEPVPNVQYTLPRPAVSVCLGSQKENLPPRGTKRAAERTPADSAPNKRPSPGQRFSDSTNTNTNASTNKDRSDVFARPMTPKARRPPPPQSSSPLFSTMRSGSSSGSSSHFSSNVGLAIMTSSPPHSLSSPTAVHISLSNGGISSKKFADLPPSSPLPDDESCSSQMTTPGTGDENDNDADADGENDDDLEEVTTTIAPVQSDQELHMELFGSMY